MFDVSLESDGRVVLRGRLDAAEAERVADRFRQIEGPAVFDCEGLDYVSSAGIALIMETYKRLHGAGHVMRLASLSPRVRNVFVYAGLDKLLGIG